ncbi:hydrolase [Beijerinckia indica]|uniref:Isochorismatase hydrolase n=1 Tax=Beijerinckia indica subsp. indica (strain ATCC 9039 / DSM 1715 / NCIMB 8712) TaxID=395963 RepID=B2IGN9_BEII9|nr:hydrolase [Beijerinckia indica]ACB95800.1 isochorismatase hydrolase [Beijerinckia indica subsp. indica ATCC 9039]
MSDLDPRTTALVLIDLQNGIASMPLAPRSGPETVAVGKTLAGRFRAAGALVVLVHVGFAEDFADAPSQLVDQPFALPEGGLPAGWTEFVEGLAQPKDIIITKRQWGAFHGTELDLQLRRRGIRTIVLGGIATNFGVESTARQAWEHGYEVLLAEDACSSFSKDLHTMAIQYIFPRITHVITSTAIGFATH